MKKAKFDQRIEDAFDAFFENRNKNDELAFSWTNQNVLMQNVENSLFIERVDSWISIFKKAFLFLPGTFVVFFTTLSSVFFYNDVGGITIWMLFWLASGSFMIWAGLGDLKNKKHLLMSLSVILTTLTFAGLLSFLPESFQPAGFFDYSIYLFPLALIIPIIVKSWIDQKIKI